MCIAIFKPADKTVKESYLKESFRYNRDGAGFAYVQNGEVKIDKGHMSYDSFITAYRTALEENKDSPFLIHFRIATLGSKDEVNTHPFPIKDGALIHNGSMVGTGAKQADGASDTSLFASKLYDKLSFSVVNKAKSELEDALSFNKVVLLYKDKSFVILNENLGHWNDGVWYSNRSYLPVSYITK